MEINAKEVYVEGLLKRSEAIDAGISSLKYNPESIVMNNLENYVQLLQAVKKDIQAELQKLNSGMED